MYLENQIKKCVESPYSITQKDFSEFLDIYSKEKQELESSLFFQKYGDSCVSNVGDVYTLAKNYLATSVKSKTHGLYCIYLSQISRKKYKLKGIYLENNGYGEISLPILSIGLRPLFLEAMDMVTFQISPLGNILNPKALQSINLVCQTVNSEYLYHGHLNLYNTGYETQALSRFLKRK